MRASRVVMIAAAASLMTSALVFAAAAPASAHNYLVASTPAEGEVLTELPEQFSITTNDALLDLSGEGSGFALQVVGPAGLYYGGGCVSVSGATMTTDAALGAAGDYEVIWQAVSVDGHTVSGEFGFTWSPEEGFAAAEGSATPPACDEDVAAGAPPATPPAEGMNPALAVGGVAAVLAAITAIFFATRQRKA